jgi:hypothetical protein
MAKERKTKQELADMIAARINVGGVNVVVFKVPQLGWDANLITAPIQASNAATMVQQIAAELRTQYDLVDD